MLHDGDAHDPWQIDLAAISGIGYPVWRGGLLCWADRLSEEQFVAMLRWRADEDAHSEPTGQEQLLLERFRSGRKFYADHGDRASAVARSG
jgi:hypothetical protein